LQTVGQAGTTQTVTSAPNPSIFGQSVTFTATVAAVEPGAGSPTGTVDFFDGATLLGTGTLTSPGVWTFSNGALAAGAHPTITADYSGDANFLGGNSPDFSQTVDQATSTTTVTSSANPSVFGQSVTFTATIAAVARRRYRNGDRRLLRRRDIAWHRDARQPRRLDLLDRGARRRGAPNHYCRLQRRRQFPQQRLARLLADGRPGD